VDQDKGDRRRRRRRRRRRKSRRGRGKGRRRRRLSEIQKNHLCSPPTLLILLH